MQKVILYLMIVSNLLVLSGCAKIADGPATPENAQRVLKLRGYNFDEKSFFAAAQARDALALNAFFDAGINPNAQNSEGRTVLIAAAARGELDVVRVLLSHNVDVNVKDNRGYTALAHAIEARYPEVEEALLSRPELDPNVGGLLNRPILLAYVWRDNQKAAERLLALGADVKLVDADGDTALHGAAETGNVEIIRLLLDKGADVNAKNKEGGTPLMWAAVFGNDEAARLLLSRGADPSLKDNDGITAVQWAVRNKRDSTASVLLKGKR
jgi:ankyrin repeat protein